MLASLDKPQRVPVSVLETNKTTNLFITYTAEMRTDQDVYMFGLDKCYITLQQANDRVELLGRCNANKRSVETKQVHMDDDNGCKCVTWGRYGSQVRFVAQAKRVDMAGEALVEDADSTTPGAWDKEEDGLISAETKLDIAGHAWVVAVHDPAIPLTDGLMRRHSLSLGRRSLSGRSSIAAKLFASTSEDNRSLGWSVDSLHTKSDLALARAKSAWNKHFRGKGRCRKVREHYGFARYALKPSMTTKRDANYDTCLQIRIERVRVVSEGELLFEHLAPAAKKSSESKPVMPPLKNAQVVGRAFEGSLVNAVTGQRSSFVDGLQQIANELLKHADNSDELPLAMKVRCERMLRFGGVTDQRYGEEEVVRDSTADLYHAILQYEGMLHPANRKVSPKTNAQSQAFLRARKQMLAALANANAVDENGNGMVEDEPRVKRSLSLNGPAHERYSSAKVSSAAVAQGDKDESGRAAGRSQPIVRHQETRKREARIAAPPPASTPASERDPLAAVSLHAINKDPAARTRLRTVRKHVVASAKDSVTGKEEVVQEGPRDRFKEAVRPRVQ